MHLFCCKHEVVCKQANLPAISSLDDGGDKGEDKS